MVEPLVRTEIENLLGNGHSIRALGAGEETLVVFPEDARQVAAILKIASRERLAVYPTGQPDLQNAPRGIVLSTGRLDRIVELDTANLTAIVEPGVRLVDFQQEVERQGLFFPPDPAAPDITLGAAVALNATGPRSNKYGSTKDYVLGLQVTLADGSLMTTGAKTVKNASGYNLTHLMVGSEGTLGVITQVSVRLLPLPEARQTLLAAFATVQAAEAAAAAVTSARLTPAAKATLTPAMLSKMPVAELGLEPASAYLLLEIDGSLPGVAREAELVAAVLKARGTEPALLSEARQQAIWDAYRQLLAQEAGEAENQGLLHDVDPLSLALMRQFKQAFDEAGILNPGVLLPAWDTRGQADGQ